MSKNTNCLKGWKCPACGNEDHFRVDTLATFDVTDEGAEYSYGDVEWGPADLATCGACGARLSVGVFDGTHRLNAEEWSTVFGDDKEHPEYPRKWWKEEVMGNDTSLGYWEWVERRVVWVDNLRELCTDAVTTGRTKSS